MVQQKQKSSGLRINTSVSPIQLLNVGEGAKYTDVLPSLNLFYDMTPQSLRFAAAKVMARPRMDDMRANLAWLHGGRLQNEPPRSLADPVWWLTPGRPGRQSQA